MPEYIAIPKNVITGDDLVKFVSKLKNLPYPDAKLLIMTPGDLGLEEFLTKHELIVARDGDVCAGYKLDGQRRVRQNVYFKEGQVVALRTKADEAKLVPLKSRNERFSLKGQRKVFVSFR